MMREATKRQTGNTRDSNALLPANVGSLWMSAQGSGSHSQALAYFGLMLLTSHAHQLPEERHQPLPSQATPKIQMYKAFKIL